MESKGPRGFFERGSSDHFSDHPESLDIQIPFLGSKYLFRGLTTYP